MAVHGPIPAPVTPLEQQKCVRSDPCGLTSHQVPRSGRTPSHHPQRRGVWWRPLLWGVLQRGGVLWRWQYAVRGQVTIFLAAFWAYVAIICVVVPCSTYETCKKMIFLYVNRYQNSDTEYETPKGYHHPDSYYDDDEQPLYRDSRRSPKRRLLPATPQGIFPSYILQHDLQVYRYLRSDEVF